MIHDLEFELKYQDKEFLVNFYTEGLHENTLMSIYMDGYPIDTIFLPATHKILFATIQTRVREEAEKFWSTKSKKAFGKLPDMVAMATNFFNKVKTI